MKKNIGLIDKKDYEDQLVPFVGSVLELFHYSLSLYLSLGHRFFLEHFGTRSKKEKKARGRKEQVRKSTTKHLQQDSSQVFICMCVFLPIFSMNGIACGYFAIMASVFLGVIVFSS